MYWVAPVQRSGDTAADERHARAVADEALPQVRELVAAMDARERNRRALEEARAHPRQIGASTTVERCEQSQAASQARLDALVDRTIAAGLRARLGLVLAIEDGRADHPDQPRSDLELLRRLMGLRSDPRARLPGGIAICRDCSIVFAPTGRKQRRRICDVCAHANLPAYLDTEGRCRACPPGAIRECEDGSLIINSLTTGVYYDRRCAACGEPYLTGRDDVRHCSKACREWQRSRDPDARRDPAYTRDERWRAVEAEYRGWLAADPARVALAAEYELAAAVALQQAGRALAGRVLETAASRPPARRDLLLADKAARRRAWRAWGRDLAALLGRRPALAAADAPPAADPRPWWEHAPTADRPDPGPGDGDAGGDWRARARAQLALSLARRSYATARSPRGT